MSSEKPQISYGDILKSMNVSLINGVLVYNSNQQKQSPHLQNYTKQQSPKQEAIPDAVKQSKVYNKYFSNYQAAPTEPEVIKPQTIEEYKNLVREEKIKRFLAQKRAERIKSTKLAFFR